VDDDGKAARIIDAGSQISGGLVGAGLGLLMAGPPGALAGGGLGPAFASGLKEVARRLLGRREEVRIGGALRYAYDAIKELEEGGNPIRTDDFFDITNSGQSSADEIVEGVLLAAQRSYEERKVQFIGYLMANIAFEEAVNRTSANWLIKTAQELTWTQLVLLSLVGRRETLNVPDVQIGRHEENWSSWGVHMELLNLAYGQRELILTERRPNLTPGTKIPGTNFDLSTMVGPSLRLRDQILTAGGQLCYTMMWLDRIDGSEIADVMKTLISTTEG
jgi:hypothetical protein